MRPLPKTIEDEFGVDCRDCRYAKKCGAAELEARRKARAHSLRYAGHCVRLTKTITIAQWRMEDATEQLDSEPPF